MSEEETRIAKLNEQLHSLWSVARTFPIDSDNDYEIIAVPARFDDKDY